MDKLTPDVLVSLYQHVHKQLHTTVLRDLATIDWHELRDAYGPADTVPALLQAALSLDDDHRNFAFQLLHERIWHQGSVFSASAVAIPFLYRMLLWEHTPDRESVAFLLASLANGHRSLYALASESEQAWEHWHQLLANVGRNLDEAIAREKDAVDKTREAIKEQLPLLFSYLDHHEPEVRSHIAQAIACYPEYAPTTLPMLQSVLMHETDEYAREDIDRAVVTLRNTSDGKEETAY